jgi:hypothetical protein
LVRPRKEKTEFKRHDSKRGKRKFNQESKAVLPQFQYPKASISQALMNESDDVYVSIIYVYS